jgi:quercetin dioxygenase-like cupin family protein
MLLIEIHHFRADEGAPRLKTVVVTASLEPEWCGAPAGAQHGRGADSNVRRAIPHCKNDNSPGRAKREAMTAQFTALRDIPLEIVTDKYSRRSLVGEKGMYSWATMKAGAHAAAHRHPHEQAFWVLSGRMVLRIGSEEHTCRQGDLALIPPNVEHEAWFPEDTEYLTMLAPPREDLLPGTQPPPHLKAS